MWKKQAPVSEPPAAGLNSLGGQETWDVGAAAPPCHRLPLPASCASSVERGLTASFQTMRPLPPLKSQGSGASRTGPDRNCLVGPSLPLGFSRAPCLAGGGSLCGLLWGWPVTWGRGGSLPCTRRGSLCLHLSQRRTVSAGPQCTQVLCALAVCCSRFQAGRCQLGSPLG